MSDSPIERLLQAVDNLEFSDALALFAPDAELLVADGRRAVGSAAVGDLFIDCLSGLRTARHVITAQWQLEDLWIAELDATYELKDETLLGAFPRAFFVRSGPQGIAALHAYGAHEHPLPKHRDGEQGTLIGTHWIPPL